MKTCSMNFLWAEESWITDKAQLWMSEGTSTNDRYIRVKYQLEF